MTLIRNKRPWFAWGAAIWAGTFGIAHLYWIAGGRFGLGNSHAADAAFERAWFVWLNAGASVACLLAVALALATIHGWGWRIPSRLLRAGLWTAATLLLVRGTLGVAQALLAQQTEAEEASPLIVLYDPWFVVGGLLFASLAWHESRLRFSHARCARSWWSGSRDGTRRSSA